MGTLQPWIEIAILSITMLATGVLAWFTWVLARATNQLAKASMQPQVTASIEYNLWEVGECDFIVENCGNAAAYDVELEITPVPELAKIFNESGLPFRYISILRPGQNMKSYLTQYRNVAGIEFEIKVNWKRHPLDTEREEVIYKYRLSEDRGKLGELNPEIQIADTLKAIRDHLEKYPISRFKFPTKLEGQHKNSD